YYKNEDHPNLVDTLSELGVTFNIKNDFKHALDMHTQALDMCKRLYKDKPHLRFIYSYMNIALVHDSKGEHRTARDYHTQAIKMCRSLNNEDNLILANCLDGVADSTITYDPIMAKEY